MEQCRILQFFFRDIFCIKCIIGSRIVQKDPINSRHCHNYRIRSCLCVGNRQFLFHVIFFQYIFYNFTKCIISDFSHKRNIGSQNLHGKPCIRHCSAGADRRIPHFNQLTRNQQFLNLAHLFSLNCRCNIHTDMPCNNDFLLHNI